MHNFKMIGKMYREIAGLDKGILPVDFFCAIKCCSLYRRISLPVL